MNSGNRVVLNDQDEQVLLHLARYRLSLTRIIQAECYTERDLKQTWGRLYTLEKAGYLAKHELPTPGKYWTLGKTGITHLGATRNWDKPLNAQSFRKWLTTLLLCFDGKKKRERLDAFQMQGMKPGGYYQKKLFDSRHYYLQHDEDCDRLVCIRPAGDVSPFMLARKCRADFTLHYEYPAFRELIDDNRQRFLVAVVVANRHQIKPIQAALRKHLEPIQKTRQADEEHDPPFPAAVFLRPGLAAFLMTGKR